MDSVSSDFILLDRRANTQNDGGYGIFVDVSIQGIGLDYANNTDNWAAGVHTASIETAGVWYHFAFVQDLKTGLLALFRDGVCHKTSSKLIADTNGTYTGILLGGAYNNNGTIDTSYMANCKMDEIRISKMARYTAQGLITLIIQTHLQNLLSRQKVLPMEDLTHR